MSSHWCHPTISSSVVPFPSCLQSFPASRSFPVSYLFAIRWPKYWSFSFNISPSNEYLGLRMSFTSLSLIPSYLFLSLSQNPCSYNLPSFVLLFVTPWTTARQASLSITNCQSLPKPMFIESVMPSNHLILCHPLPLLLSVFPIFGVFSSKSALLIRWPKYWSFSFSISPSNEYLGLISFQIDWSDLFAVRGLSRVFFSINSLVLSLLYGPTLTSIHDHWENHSLD